MRYKLFAVLVTCICILSFSFIFVSALESTVDYTVQNSLGQNAVPPLHLSEYPSSQYVCFVLFGQNSSGYGYWGEYYVPKISGVSYFLGIRQGVVQVLATNSTSSSVSASTDMKIFIYDESGQSVVSRTSIQSSYAKSLPANITVPRTRYSETFFSGYCGTTVQSWFVPFFDGEAIYYDGTSFDSYVPLLNWSFTFNREDTKYDPETGEPIGDGGNTGCQCVDYTSVLQTIISNQGTQLEKLNQIISILQNQSNQDVINAVNNAVDEVNDNLNTPTKDVPSDYENEGIDDYNTESAATDEALDDFKDGNTFSDIFDDFNLTSFREAMEFWKDKFDDIIDTNSVFPVVITSVLTLGLIAVILNRKVGVG